VGAVVIARLSNRARIQAAHLLEQEAEYRVTAQLLQIVAIAQPHAIGGEGLALAIDGQEICLLLEGDVTVTPDVGEPVRFGAGDLMVFDTGLSCTWEVHAPVCTRYLFG
jgi:hypothetical protein